MTELIGTIENLSLDSNIILCKEIYQQYNNDGNCKGCLFFNKQINKCTLLKHTHPDIHSQIDIKKTLYSNYIYLNIIEKTMIENKNSKKEIDLFIERNRLTEEKIENITYGSGKKIWFLCPNTNCDKKCSHSYETCICDRTIKKSRCPFCSKNKLKICKCNSFMNNPLLALQYDWDKNKGIDPWTLSHHSGVKLWWKCIDHKTCEEHSWESTINHRSNERECPFCTIGGSDKTCFCNSLFTTHPDICKFIKEENNPELDIKKITSGSTKMINFECECDYKWSQALFIRTRPTTSSICPLCTIKSNFSNFERRCNEILIKSNINPTLQYKFNYIPSREFDFAFHYNTINYIIETDGEPHFRQNTSWHPTEEIFIKQQNADIIKTLVPLYNNFCLLRMSDDKQEHIEQCIKFLLCLKVNKPTIVFDNIEKYSYIVNINNNCKKDIIDISDLIDTFVDQPYREITKHQYNTWIYDIVDIKTKKKYCNYL